MLKIARFLEKNRSLVFVLLITPSLGLFLGERFSLSLIPENPYPRFEVTFNAPSVTAQEIEKKVTQPVEKIFNGLPKLISMTSTTNNEVCKILLTFSSSLNHNSVFLNIQEKMDRIRLILPRDVKSYNVQRLQLPKPAHLEFTSETPVSLSQWSKVLKPYLHAIEKTSPPLESKSFFKIQPLPEKLFQHKVSISQLVNALQTLGFKSSLGENGGLVYETSASFDSVESLRGTVIAAKGHRLIKLTDLAKIELQTPKSLHKFSIWINLKFANQKDIIQRIKQNFSQIKVHHPLNESFFKQSFHPILLISFYFLLQILVVRFLRMPWSSLLFMGLMGLIVSVHFLFWKGLFSPPISVLDLHALAFTLLIGSIFLAILYLRIRSYFLPEDLIQKSPKSLQQAKLFSLAELLPTFFTLIIIFWIAMIPVMNTAINFPSRYILESLFYFGIPILLLVIIVLPLSSSDTFLSSNVSVPKAKMLWEKFTVRSNIITWSILFLAGLGFLLFFHFDFSSHSQKTNLQTSVDQLRGYQDHLVYKTQTQPQHISSLGFQPRLMQTQKVHHVHTFSLSGLRFINHLDLMGFISALKSLQSKSSVGWLEKNLHSSAVPIHLSSSQIHPSDLKHLFFASSHSQHSPKHLQTLTRHHLQVLPTQIIHDNLMPGHLIQRPTNSDRPIFEKVQSAALSPSAWSSFLLKEFKNFKSMHSMSYIFIFFALSIYLNSFIRSMLIMVFASTMFGITLALRQVFPSFYHADSLWILYVPVLLGLLQILVLTRIIDIERTRGHDRDLCVDEVRKEMAPGIYLCSWVFVIGLILGGVCELLSIIPSMGLWKEGLFISLCCALILPLSTHVFFPLFYLESEETLSRIGFRIYRLWRRR